MTGEPDAGCSTSWGEPLCRYYMTRPCTALMRGLCYARVPHKYDVYLSRTVTTAVTFGWSQGYNPAVGTRPPNIS